MVRSGVLIVVSAVGPGTQAFAQDAAIRLDEIVVFGGARDERRLLDTPNAVTVIDSFEIERRQPATYEELLGDVPGVTIEGGPRGISQDRTSGASRTSRWCFASTVRGRTSISRIAGGSSPTRRC